MQAIYGQITAIPNVKKVRNLSILNAMLTDDNGDSIQLNFFQYAIFKKGVKTRRILSVPWSGSAEGTHKIMEQPRMFTWEEYQKKSGRLPAQICPDQRTDQPDGAEVRSPGTGILSPGKEYLPQSVLQKYPCFPTGKLSMPCIFLKTERNC